MEGKGERVSIHDENALLGGQLDRARFLAERVHREIRPQAHRTGYLEFANQDRESIFDSELSPWTRSRAKRALDVGIVLAFSPVLFVVLAAIAMAVLVTSGAPVLFRQERAGRNGEPFLISKFRTMRPAPVHPSSALAIASASRITWLGAFLRKSKLDELPQIFNVLAGEMSLVGPRPKVPEQQPEPLPCLPGVTGVATLAFAREETLLQEIDSADRDEYFNTTILLAKRNLDANYLRRATIWSDLWILVNTASGRWGAYNQVTSLLPDDENRLEPSGEPASLSQ